MIIADALDFQYAGIKVYLEGLVQALQSGDFRHEYILIRADEDFRDYAGQVFVKSYVSKLLHPKSRLLVEIPQTIKQMNPDVVVEPTHFGPFRLNKEIKKVTFIHDLTPIHYPEFHSSSSSLLHKLLLPGILKRASLIITNSHCTKSDVVSHYAYANGKTEVIYPGKTELIPSDQLTIEGLNLSTDRYILHVGTIEPRKNLHLLLKIFEKIKKYYPEIKLVLVGREGWKMKTFLQELEQHPFRSDIIKTGYIDSSELATVYNHAVCLMLTSHYEGFGIPLLEAMTCGCPVITYNNSAQAEVCANAALYMNTSDTEAWMQAFHTLYSNPEFRASCIEKGYQRATYFNWNKSAQLFDQYISELFIHDYHSKA